MEGHNEVNELQQDAGRSFWPLLFIALVGMGLSAIFILLSFNPFTSSDETSISQGNLPASTVVASVDSAFTTGSLPDPRAGSMAGDGQAVVGQPAPNFTLPTLDGDTISLSDYIGQPVLINFWATWCAPCRIEMPELVRAYEEHQDEGFVILAVDLAHQDSIDDVRTFAEEFQMNFPVLLDETGDVSGEMYRLLGLPMSVFVDREGRIERIYVGLMTAEQIDTFVGEILE